MLMIYLIFFPLHLLIKKFNFLCVPFHLKAFSYTLEDFFFVLVLNLNHLEYFAIDFLDQNCLEKIKIRYLVSYISIFIQKLNGACILYWLVKVDQSFIQRIS